MLNAKEEGQIIFCNLDSHSQTSYQTQHGHPVALLARTQRIKVVPAAPCHSHQYCVQVTERHMAQVTGGSDAHAGKIAALPGIPQCGCARQQLAGAVLLPFVV